MPEYLIAHIGHTLKHHEHVTWWHPDSRGYTVCIDKAGLYDEAEARSICASPSCIAVPKSVAESVARSTPYYRLSDGTLAKMYDGGPHRVVPNELLLWKALLSGRLARCAHPIKPTPISVAKARAIYLQTEGGAA
jgi:hypothetical protein